MIVFVKLSYVDIRQKSGNIIEIGMRINLENDVLWSEGGTVHLI